uniref:RING-type domain-containing protein n=1 Tax=Opuntia streptacantha TaxID=393608 RepID=A0A7C8ZDJ9_OPUST
MVMACSACIVYAFLGRLAAYFALLALLVVISCLVLKCLGEWRLSSLGGRRGGGERSPLMGPYYVSKTVTINYGTCQHGDLESGSCSNANGSSSDATLQCWEELYDAKICVICYDQPRNCFLVPCGHCATCHDCALRIFHEDNRKCPVCRRYIGKVRKLFGNYNVQT